MKMKCVISAKGRKNEVALYHSGGIGVFIGRETDE